MFEVLFEDRFLAQGKDTRVIAVADTVDDARSYFRTAARRVY